MGRPQGRFVPVKVHFLVPVLLAACGGPQYHSNIKFDSFPRVTLLDPGQLYSNPQLARNHKIDIKAKLLAAGIPAGEVDDVIKHSEERGWPRGFNPSDANFDHSDDHYDKFKALHLRMVVDDLGDESSLVMAPAAENQGMPADFRPNVDIYLNIKTSALSVAASDSRAKSARPVTANEPAAMQCTQVADHMLAAVPADMKFTPDQATKIRSLMVARCTEDRWSAEIQQCVLTSTNGNEDRCQKLFTPAQADAIKRMGDEIAKLIDHPK